MNEEEENLEVQQEDNQDASNNDDKTVTNIESDETVDVNKVAVNSNGTTDDVEGATHTVNQPPQFVMPRMYVKEKPKVPVKKDDDDIEEFDTDEEDDETAEQPKDSTQQTENRYAENISYEGDKCIYTEPGTGRKMLWNSEENKWCDYGETDKAEGQTSESTEPPTGVYGFENDTHTYTDPTDGSVYFWDKEKNAWFPKVDDDFMARYQMSYGFTNTTQNNSPKEPETSKPSKEEKKAENKRKNQEAPTWFDVDEAHNTTVYISNLPLDITMEELKELVGKCGLLARDEKGKDKLKLYTDADGEVKGDARCTYIKAAITRIQRLVKSNKSHKSFKASFFR